MDNIILSIIVPVYNAEQYIMKGISSLLNQTLNELEILCIDDGSSDNSLKILKKLQTQYPYKILVFHQEHQGVYYARSLGIKKAKGKYIGFMDIDDCVNHNMYQALVEHLKKSNADMAFCGYYRVDRATNKVLSKEMTQYGDAVIDVSEDKSECLAINTAIWNKVIRSDLVKQHIIFEHPPRMLEDMMFLLSLYPNINKIDTLKEAYYTYYVSTTSVMNTIQQNELAQIQAAMIQTKNVILKNGNNINLKNLISGMAFIHFGISLVLYLSKGNMKETAKRKKQISLWLDYNFNGWQTNQYLSWRCVFKKKKNLIKPVVALWMYRTPFFTFLIKIYFLVTEKMHFDIKW